MICDTCIRDTIDTGSRVLAICICWTYLKVIISGQSLFQDSLVYIQISVIIESFIILRILVKQYRVP